MPAIDSPSTITEDEFPVSVILSRDEVQVGRWRAPRWRALGVVAGTPACEDPAAARGADVPGASSLHARQVVAEDGQVAHLWSGFTLRLYPDSTESYWHNLLGQQPSLFVICRPNEDDELEPCAVSADYDEAGAYMEADDTVLATPMPPEIYRWLEEYVVKYFRPTETKVRKRKNWWLEISGNDAGPRRGR